MQIVALPEAFSSHLNRDSSYQMSSRPILAGLMVFCISISNQFGQQTDQS